MNRMRVVPEWQTYLPHVLVIALCWALVMSMDYADAAAQAEAQAQEMSAQMAACLRGDWRGRTESGTQIGCMPAVTFEQHERTSK